MPLTSDVIGFVAVRDLARAESFYDQKLGLRVIGKDGFALVLRTSKGTMIRCVLMPEVRPVPYTILGWEVADIASAAAELREFGIQAKRYPYFEQDAEGVWTAPDGSKVLWFEDPDGNLLSFSQHVGGAV